MLRKKRRYLLVRVFPPDVETTPEQLRRIVAVKVAELGGWLSLAESEISVKRARRASNEFILKCSLKSIPLVLFSTALVQRLGNAEKVRLDVVKISGTLRALME